MTVYLNTIITTAIPTRYWVYIKDRRCYSWAATKGPKIFIEKGDVLVIPAGVAHKNLGAENSVGVIGAYPKGRHYDMNYGNPEERPGTDKNISKVPVPESDPVWGKENGLTRLWNHEKRKQKTKKDLSASYNRDKIRRAAVYRYADRLRPL